jgi:hypothetical protein
MIALVIVCMVLTGTPSRAALNNETVAASSAQAPL